MIAVDTSAIISALYGELEEGRVRTALKESDGAIISTANVLELQLVVAGSRSKTGWSDVEALLASYRIETHPFDQRQLRIAREAAVRYGKGRHKARLNFGDCFAYALAKCEDIPLLCTGSDFAETDVVVA
ncbi:MAG TPA: type II toxin-antitoxin system VapC family toxin [Rhizomicrobium sp.]|nr:type II toxin-antitoxin system VapC family toxin [Rhizomicrobium sp.]